MLATYFVHDGETSSSWRLKGHAESKFWEWIATWAVVMKSPSDIGHDAECFVLPELKTDVFTVEYDYDNCDESEQFSVNILS